MVHPAEFHTGLIAISSVFIAIAGILVAILVTRGKPHEWPNRLLIWLELVSILLGAISMISALAWFSKTYDWLTLIAGIALLLQFLAIYVPLVVLMLKLGRQ